MELDWTTFFLEIINFLILVWLLHRFFYRPVLDFIARRRAETEEAQANARRDQQEAEALKRQYESRLSDWAKERDVARQQLRREMEQERLRRLEEIKLAIDEERKKAEVAEERRRREMREHTEQNALILGARFAAQLLERSSGKESTKALVELVEEGIRALSTEQRADLRKAGKNAVEHGVVEGAHSVEPAQRESLETALSDLFGKHEWEWHVVPELIAGVRITLGAWVLAANARDELKDFAGLIHVTAS